MTDCYCGHPQDDHPEEHALMCVRAHCECPTYRVRPIGAARPASRPTLRDLIAAGKTSKRPRARTLADRIETSIAQLVHELRDERERQAHEALLRTAPTTGGRKRPVEQVCPDCDKVCASGTGLSAHRRNAHLPMATTDCPECGRPIKKTGIGAHRRLAHGIRKAAA